MVYKRNKTDESDDDELLTVAMQRMEYADPAFFVSADRLYKELGITQDNLDAIDDVDID